MRGARFGIVALIPAMFNLTVAAANAGTITVQICTGDGQTHQVQVPVGGSQGNGGDKQGLCCAKGCHSGNQRKRLARQN